MSKSKSLRDLPNKDALLDAIVDRRITRFEQFIVHVLSLLEGDERTKEPLGVLLAPLGNNPQLLARYKNEYKQLLDETRQTELTFGRAAVIMLAAGYLELMDLFSLLPFQTEEIDRAIEF